MSRINVKKTTRSPEHRTSEPFSKRACRLRVLLVGAVFSAWFLVIGAKAAYIQVCRGPWLSEIAANQYEISMTSRGKRGTIYDANLREMAVSIRGISLGAHPGQMEEPSVAAGALARALDLNAAELKKKLSSKSSFVWIKRQITPREAKTVSGLKIKGVSFTAEHSRFNPGKTLAAQVVGLTGIDGEGLEGLEFSYDEDLKGQTGNITVMKDASGAGFVTEKKDVPDIRGNNLILTIDQAIQFITEKALEESVKEASAKSGMAVVMDPKTGAILAMAHFPFFNPNAYGEFDRELWRNRAITDVFEPGSTMKIFTAAAALESGKCTPNSVFYCENGKYRVGRHVVHDTHSYKDLTLAEVVKYSSNIGASKIVETIGSENLHRVLSDFGFGEKTDLDCPGEASGTLSPFKRWKRIEAANIAFGQGVSVSAVGLTAAAGALANDGIRMKPYLVQAVTDPNGRLLKRTEPTAVKRAVSPETARTVREIMKTVVTEGGTGVSAAMEGYSVCGKTGTAQKIGEKGGYARGRYVASFIGFVPAEAPEAVILVIIDEPKKSHYGGIVAAPAFRKIAYETLVYRNIPARMAEAPEKPEGTQGKIRRLQASFKVGPNG